MIGLFRLSKKSKYYSAYGYNKRGTHVRVLSPIIAQGNIRNYLDKGTEEEGRKI